MKYRDKFIVSTLWGYRSCARTFVVFSLLLTLSISAHAGQGEQPKSNFIARAKLLASNELSVTIAHSKAGQKNAFEFAATHCAKFGKLAVVQSSTPQLADNITTWACIAPQSPTIPTTPVQPTAPN